MQRMVIDSNEMTALGEYDLLVIGGGINGTGVARDAAGRGLSVILCEKGDLGEGTSSRSTKYVHGGLRYLEHREFGLVRKALIEREIILDIAPHLARPLRLILVHSSRHRPRWLMRLGLFVYDHLGGRKRIPSTEVIDLLTSVEGQAVRPEYSRGFAYWDVWVDDSRLVIANARDASLRGAQILRSTEVLSAHRRHELWEVTLRPERGQQDTVRARAIVNCAGPWVQTVLAQAEAISKKRIRLVKGSHIITRRWWKGDFGFVLQADDGRIIFVNPYFDDLALIGTTDIPFDGRPEDSEISLEETDYLISIVNEYFEVDLTRPSVITSYSGVRPLLDDDGTRSASTVTRDYQLELDADGNNAPFLSVFGGKLTTYRKLAEEVMAKLRPHFPNMPGPWTQSSPLLGGEIGDGGFENWLAEFQKEFPWLPDRLAQHYGRNYGSEARLILEGADSLSALGLHFGSHFFEREARWLFENEWARDATDILQRRTKHGLFLTSEQELKFEAWRLRHVGTENREVG